MDRDQTIKQWHDFWFALIQKAFDKSAFDALCTLLRPRGMHDAGWDVLDESEATFEDFNWMLSKAEKEKGTACVGLTRFDGHPEGGALNESAHAKIDHH